MSDRDIVTIRLMDAARERVKQFVVEANEQNFDKLEAVLAANG